MSNDELDTDPLARIPTPRRIVFVKDDGPEIRPNRVPDPDPRPVPRSTMDVAPAEAWRPKVKSDENRVAMKTLVGAMGRIVVTGVLLSVMGALALSGIAVWNFYQ